MMRRGKPQARSDARRGRRRQRKYGALKSDFLRVRYGDRLRHRRL